MQLGVGIVGAGEMGQALGGVLEQQEQVRVYYFDKEPRIAQQVGLAEVASVSDIIMFCIPSTANRSVAQELAALIPENKLVLSVSKGLERGTRQTMDEVLRSMLPSGVAIGLLYGPMLAEEIAGGLPTAGVVALSDEHYYTRFAALWQGTHVHMTYHFDVHGVAIAGVLKNVYAIGLGALDATELGYNVRGWYLVQALSEMRAITKRLGGKEDTAMSLAGLGDLLTTGSTPCSRNYTVGQELARLGKPQSQSEGLISLPTLLELLDQSATEYPLLQTLATLLDRGGSVEDLFYETTKSS